MSEEKLLAKLFISGKIEALTGLHIGGSSTALDIGGIDLNVIKTANGVPFIPGSSLKGKIRSLLEIQKNDKKDEFFTTDGIHCCNNKNCDICNIFGRNSGKKKHYVTDEQGKYKKDNKGEIEEKHFEVEYENVTPTRLIVRDACLDEDDFKKKFDELELDYTEAKWENTIDRLTAKAKNPRQLERVPAGAVFEYEMVYNILKCEDVDYIKTLIQGMRLLEDDYLGGSGSRGYGRVKFNEIKIEIKTAQAYEENNQRVLIQNYHSTNHFNPEVLVEKIKETLI